MTEQLSPAARALLDQARGSHGPEERDRERVLTNLHASLGIAATLTLASSAKAASDLALVKSAAANSTLSLAETAAPVATQAAAASVVQGTGATAWSGFRLAGKLLTWKAGKVLLASLALGSAIGVSQLPKSKPVVHEEIATRSARMISRAAEQEHARGGAAAVASQAPERAAAPEQDQVSAEAQPNVAAQPRIQAQPSTDSEALSRIGVDVATVDTDAPTHRSTHRRSERHRTHSVRIRKHTSSVAEAQPADAELAQASEPAEKQEPSAIEAPRAPQELELIRRAMTRLRDHDAAGALALLDEHQQRYPRGAFATERRGLHVLALCEAGQLAAGRSEQASFLRSDGQAPIAARVRKACVEPKK